MRQHLTVLGLALVAGFPRIAAAQSPEPPLPPIVPAGPAALDSRPMRFLLSTGAVVIGTRIGESPTAIGVRTANGIVTIYKSQVVTMDYRVEMGRDFGLRYRPGPVPIARPAPAVPPRFTPSPELRREVVRRSRPGRAATIAGGIVFGISYGICAIGAVLTVSIEGQTGMLLGIPVVGPVAWGLTDPESRLPLGALLTGIQSLGTGLLVYGIVRGRQAESQGRLSLAVTPVLMPDVQGLVVSGVL